MPMRKSTKSSSAFQQTLECCGRELLALIAHVGGEGKMRKFAFAVAVASSLTMSASTRANDDYSDTPVFGGNGGGRFWAYCPKNTYLIGIGGRTGAWIDAIQPICARLNSTGKAFDVPVTGHTSGGSGGGPATLMCPAGMVIMGWEIAKIAIHDVWVVKYVRPQCETILHNQQVSAQIPGQFGAAGAADPKDRIGYKCPAGMLAIGIYGASGDYVDNAGLNCEVPSTLIIGEPETYPELVKSIGKIPGTSQPVGPPRSICDAARDARARNSPAAPNLEAQCHPEPIKSIGRVPSALNGVIYAINKNNDLLWYRHDGYVDGSFTWLDNNARKIGNGWNVKQFFYSGDGIVYAINQNNDLMWYRHDGRNDGSFKWADNTGRKVGVGWDVKHIFYGGDGVIYTINQNNDLMWYRHDGRNDGSFKWADNTGRKVGVGWDVKHIFYGGKGVIYAINQANDLLWYRHDGHDDGSFTWLDNNGRKVGNGWDVNFIASGSTLVH